MPGWSFGWAGLWGASEAATVRGVISVMGISLIKLAWDNDTQSADAPLTENSFLDSASGFETAVTISLFSWARVDEADPKTVGQKWGWWGDTFAPNSGDNTGSKLWLLRRAKVSADTMGKAKAYALEALQWMIDDGVAKSVAVEVERYDLTTIAMKVSITRREGGKWDGVWKVHLDGI